MSRYKSFTKNELASVIPTGFNQIQEGNESVFVWPGQVVRGEVKLYTSLTAYVGEARGCGDDAVRVVAFVEDKGKFLPIFRQRLYRTTNLFDRLPGVIHQAMRALDCRSKCTNCSCNGILVLRMRKADKKEFMGCSNWPICNFTKNI